RQDAIHHQGEFAYLDILKHKVDRLRNLNDVIVDRIAKADLRQEQGEVQATIVKKPASSGQIVSPRLSQIVLLCLVSTALFGSGLVYIQDIIDDRFRTPDELSTRVGTQVLAMIGDLESVPEGDGLASVQAHASPNVTEIETFRTLRTALELSGSETNRVVMTSSEPGDGKTTTIANLAVVYAQAGKRTLLIDSDLRRPGLTKLLGMKGRQGLSDILHSNEMVSEVAEQCVIGTDNPLLDVLLAGPRRQNPSELIGSDRMADLLAWAETIYDQILIDSPPVLVASDSTLLARLVDGVILVVRPQKNRRRLVYRAAESLSNVGIHLFGIVANCIGDESGKSFLFSDSYGYGYEYGYGYGSDEEEEDEPLDVKIPSIDFGAETVQVHEDSYQGRSGLTVPRRAA
ncbi:MAG: CpsD/CapB family tyrosine-protein kinase, partial [Planctomycetales bacterium]